MAHTRIAEIFNMFGNLPPEGAFVVHSPADGQIIAQLAADTSKTLEQKITKARATQAAWAKMKRDERAALLEKLAIALKTQRELLAEIIMVEAGKTRKEALAEADGVADVLPKTIKDAALPDLGNMARSKDRPAAGVVGLITSFNFPLAVAGWTIAPALLAANAVLWKPSEKTPLVALAYKCIFDKAMGAHSDLLHIIVGGRDMGEALVLHEDVDMISATGSVAMGKGIKAALAKKKNNAVKPILELGGNNGVIISDKMSPAHLEWSLAALMNSFLGTAGQRCTNTRRLIVHENNYDRAVEILKKLIENFLQNKVQWEDYGYGPLIDKDAYARFEHTKKQATGEGGKILFGARLPEKSPDAYYVEPTLALMPRQTKIMQEETFAPLLFIAPYTDFKDALAMLNAPANAGLVSAIYTQNQEEADQFAMASEAGHVLINPPKGTGTPAHGMGFGGNKDSGEGEILNAADPLRPFTRDGKFSRIAQNKDVAMDH
jgi:aldehyde dehydrogenase (NAD+)